MRAKSVGVAVLVLLLPCAIARGATSGPGWPQWGGGPEHNGEAAAAGQPLAALLADVVYDPFVDLETAEAAGELLAHYAVPLLDDSGVYMEIKGGSYLACFPPGSGMPFPCGPDAWGLQVWKVQKFVWRGGALVEDWSFASDWKPEPAGGGMGGWEPVFQPVLAGDFVYVPGAGGTVFKLSKQSGAVVSRINPFGELDRTIFVAGGLAADASGNVLYNAMRLDSSDPWGSDVRGAWLTKIAPDDTATKAAFASLVPGAPPASAPCEVNFSANDLPWPPSARATAPTIPCGSQRPGVNVIPAIASDGTIYTVSRAHAVSRYGYLVAVRPDLTPAWSASLRGILNDGCDVLLPPSGSPGGCRAGAARGVDPATNNRPAGRVLDFATSSPVVLRDGTVLYGAFTGYNFQRGHLLAFGSDGQPLAAYDFGWDITPAVFRHGGTYSIVLKDNHYAVGSYCGDPRACPAEQGRYDLVSLSPDLSVEWTFRNTNTQSCERGPDGAVSCVSDHPDGFEWCINQPAVDANGVVYATSEDGFLYAIDAAGAMRERIFLNLALGAAYTPLSLSCDGLIFAQNNGHLFVVGDPFRPSPQPARETGRPRSIGFR